jgi:serine-type D-Ala-D-Ala carboxypeptidase/endopeptidase (penicillin-binding protein 4)
VRSTRPAILATLLLLLGAVSCTGDKGAPAPTSDAITQAPPSSVGSASPTSSAPVQVALINASWTRAIRDAVAGRSVSVTVGYGDRIVFEFRSHALMLPASNEKLLTSMTALDELGPGSRFPTRAEASSRPAGGTVKSNLWLIGSGDPELTDASMQRLAKALVDAGVRRIDGSVIGDTSAFDRGWWAHGWDPGISRSYVTRATALAINGNTGSEIPELAAAASLTEALRSLGVTVSGAPRAGTRPAGLKTIALIRSAQLRDILERQNHGSINFDAEMIAKALGTKASGEPGSTASGARAIGSWVSKHGVRARVYDGSGLSHADAISSFGLAELLLEARHETWGGDLYDSLPGPGEGTLEGRLAGLPVRAKTGSLFVEPASALSGYVRTRSGRLLAFSVISRGLDRGTAIAIEDAVVSILARTP